MGSLPMEIGDITNLASFDLSYNNFSGMIPSTIGKCLALELLYMQHNSFEGSIPYLADLQNLQELDLSRNNLSGEIPPWTMNLSSLLYLNLPDNNLEGEAPVQGVFSNSTALQVEGNPKLCGGIQEFDLPPSPNQENHRTKRKRLTPVLTTIISIVLFAALACFLTGPQKSQQMHMEKHQIYGSETQFWVRNFQSCSFSPQELDRLKWGNSRKGHYTVKEGIISPKGNSSLLTNAISATSTQKVSTTCYCTAQLPQTSGICFVAFLVFRGSCLFLLGMLLKVGVHGKLTKPSRLCR
ncbi:hypothetical protein KY290_007586 [Solanum tuberosum]|uniref:Uncharacterized protein n=1 Tax=Solanum tuberosum TaxID=4113 RepID=A0ABQ7W861_SOLTU|nr:hypothetical protein KY290_007586 [Solanum tuberosum]